MTQPKYVVPILIDHDYSKPIGYVYVSEKHHVIARFDPVRVVTVGMVMQIFGSPAIHILEGDKQNVRRCQIVDWSLSPSTPHPPAEPKVQHMPNSEDFSAEKMAAVASLAAYKGMPEILEEAETKIRTASARGEKTTLIPLGKMTGDQKNKLMVYLRSKGFRVADSHIMEPTYCLYVYW